MKVKKLGTREFRGGDKQVSNAIKLNQVKRLIMLFIAHCGSADTDEMFSFCRACEALLEEDGIERLLALNPNERETVVYCGELVRRLLNDGKSLTQEERDFVFSLRASG